MMGAVVTWLSSLILHPFAFARLLCSCCFWGDTFQVCIGFSKNLTPMLDCLRMSMKVNIIPSLRVEVKPLHLMCVRSSEDLLLAPTLRSPPLRTSNFHAMILLWHCLQLRYYLNWALLVLPCIYTRWQRLFTTGYYFWVSASGEEQYWNYQP